MILQRQRERRGVSLGEAIIACFVLTFAMLISASLYHTALQYSVRIDRKQRAARVAEQRVEEIRSWSRQHHGTNGELAFSEGWEAYQDVQTEDPDNPGYQIHTDVEPKALFSPSSEFEEVFFAAQEDENIPNDSELKRTLGDSSYLVTVTVTWGPSAAERLVTSTLVTDPVRDHGWDANNAHQAITISYGNGGGWNASAPASIGPNGQLQVRAEIQDRHGELVRNPVVQWYVDPDCTGKGTLVSLPDSAERATFINRVEIEKPDGTTLNVLTGGSVRLVARVRLGGIEAVRATPLINLQD